MTPSERLLKSVHMEIEKKRAWLDTLALDDTHQYIIRVKPRGEGSYVSIGVEAREDRV